MLLLKMLWTRKTILYILTALCFSSLCFLYLKYPLVVKVISDRRRLKSMSLQIFQNQTLELPLCPEQPSNLSLLLFNMKKNMSLTDISSENPNLQFGGRGMPKFCKAQQKIAIIIPYRNRKTHLKIWLQYLHPMLQKQQGDYGVYVIEQIENTTFNRGKLMNVGFTEARKDYDYDCFIFSDVDIIPMDERNLYRCSQNPKHLANSVDKFNFRLPYETIFGGIVAFTKEQFLKVNGFSNHFWGWGGEDDELYNRVVAVGMKIERPDPSISRSRMIVHKRDPGNEANGKSFHLIHQVHRFMHEDGLNTLKYDVISYTKSKVFTKITVDIGEVQY